MLNWLLVNSHSGRIVVGETTFGEPSLDKSMFSYFLGQMFVDEVLFCNILEL